MSRGLGDVYKRQVLRSEVTVGWEKSRKWEGMGYNKALLTVLRSEVTAGWENQESGREWVTTKHS